MAQGSERRGGSRLAIRIHQPEVRIRVVAVDGVIDAATVGTLATVLRSVADLPGGGSMMIDLDAVEFCGECVLGALHVARERAASSGTTVRTVATPGGAAARVLGRLEWGIVEGRTDVPAGPGRSRTGAAASREVATALDLLGEETPPRCDTCGARIDGRRLRLAAGGDRCPDHLAVGAWVVGPGVPGTAPPARWSHGPV